MKKYTIPILVIVFIVLYCFRRKLEGFGGGGGGGGGGRGGFSAGRGGIGIGDVGAMRAVGMRDIAFNNDINDYAVGYPSTTTYYPYFLQRFFS